MKITNKYLIGLVALVASFGIMLSVKQQSVQAEKVTYSVAPIYPTNQTDPDLGYYDLKVTPGLKQEIGLVVQNSGNKAIKVDVTPNTAITNQNGLIDYTQSNGKHDSTLKYPFDQLMSASQRVTVPAKGAQTVMFTLTAPKTTFNGNILGGFYITPVSKSKVAQSLEIKKGASLTNQYSYILGVRLSATDQNVNPNLRLNKVKAGLRNSHTAILANVQNTKARSLGEMSVKAKIRKVGQSKVLYQNTNKEMQMAPNSNFNYAIDLKNKPIKAGHYNLKMHVKSNRGSWVLSKNFTITAKEARKYNPKAVELPKTNWWPYIIIGLLAVIILFLIWLLWKRRKNDEDEPTK